MFKLHLIFVVNIKFPWATYHRIVPSTEELYCLISLYYLGKAFAHDMQDNPQNRPANLQNVQIWRPCKKAQKNLEIGTSDLEITKICVK